MVLSIGQVLPHGWMFMGVVVTVVIGQPWWFTTVSNGMLGTKDFLLYFG